jgi:hypothetical protein
MKYVTAYAVPDTRDTARTSWTNLFRMSGCNWEVYTVCDYMVYYIQAINEGKIFEFYTYYGPNASRDNSVGIAIGYGLDGPGIESRWE